MKIITNQMLVVSTKILLTELKIIWGRTNFCLLDSNKFNSERLMSKIVTFFTSFLKVLHSSNLYTSL